MLRKMFCAMAVMAAFLCCGTAQAAPCMTDACGQKIRSYDYLVDWSGSMMLSKSGIQNGMQKISAAKSVLLRLNAMMPQAEWRAGLHTLAPAGTVVPFGEWDRKKMAAGIEKISADKAAYGRMTDMGDSMSAMIPDLSGMGASSAIILLTDGGNNRGLDPAVAVEHLRASNPGRPVHVISFADTAEGIACVKKIASMTPGAVVGDGWKMLNDSLALDVFIKRVFVDDVAPHLQPVYFEFGKDRLTSEAKSVLDETAEYINNYCRSHRVLIVGYADEIGTDARNTPLSQRRANAVKRYLSMKGVPAKRMLASGHGESTLHGSDEKGRALNRRVTVKYE